MRIQQMKNQKWNGTEVADFVSYAKFIINLMKRADIYPTLADDHYMIGFLYLFKVLQDGNYYLEDWFAKSENEQEIAKMYQSALIECWNNRKIYGLTDEQGKFMGELLRKNRAEIPLLFDGMHEIMLDCLKFYGFTWMDFARRS